MRNLFVSCCLILSSCLSSYGQTDQNLGLHSGGGPWNFYPATEKNDSLKNVLLIGDSVMNGFRQFVIDSLKKNANVDCWLTPMHLNSEHLFADLQKVVSSKHYDVIQFNIGLHGWPKGRIKDNEYVPLLEKYVKTLIENAKFAKLIWASITPVTEQDEAALNKEINPIIAERNKLAGGVMKKYKIQVNDLYGLVVDKLHLARLDRFHWKAEGYQLMANQSISFIQNELGNKHNDKFIQLSPGNLQIGGEIGRRIDVTMNNNLKKLSLEKNFTSHFEDKTGPEVVGSFIGVGMLIDAWVRFAAYSMDPEMIKMKNQIVQKIIGTQLDNGYIGFYKPSRRLWNSQGSADNWDIHEMAFIIDGLLSDYQFYGNKTALNAAIKTADYIISRWHEMPENYAAVVDLHVLDTGFDGAILRLYRFTGEERFLNFSENIKSLYKWDTPITIGRRVGVSGHMFAYFAMCLAQQELYRLTNNEVLLQQTKNAISFFLEDDGLTITGSAGIREIWTTDQDGEGELGETCATAYQLRNYESLLRLSGDPKYGDLIERTVFNGLFAAQSPEGDEIRYYTPFEGQRKYFHVEYMCCPGNYRRIISELPGMVYYSTSDGGIAVNLFAESNATLVVSGNIKVIVSQQTDYPSNGKIELFLTPDKESQFPVKIRIPAWVKNPKVFINNELYDVGIEAGSFLSINRKWKRNDKITLDFPMEFRFVKGRKRNAGRVAIMRGPVIYGLNLEKNTEATVNGKRDYNDLRRILLDPSTLSEVIEDNSVRPHGTAVYISGWREEYSGLTNQKHEFKMKLTEFPDPASQFIYFKIPDYSVEVDDELNHYN